MTGLTHFVDQRLTTGNNDGTTKANAFQKWAFAAVFMNSQDTRSDDFVFVSGSSSQFNPHREPFTVTGLSGSPANPYNIRAEIPGEEVVFFNSFDLTGLVVNPSAGGTNEFYVTGPAGADPSISLPPVITVDGYYQASAGGEPDSSRTIGTPGSLTADKFSGYGDNDTLGFNTVYFRYDSGVAANAIVEMSLTGEIFNSNLPGYNIDDIVFGYGTNALTAKGNETVFQRCALIYQDLTGSTHNNTATITYISCIGFWAGHRFGQSTNNSPNVRYFNCTDYSAHLFYLMEDTADGGLVEIINTIGDNAVAGVLDKQGALPTLTETSNHWSPRMVQGGGDILYNTQLWAATTGKSSGSKVLPTTPNGFYYITTDTGNTGGTEPNFPTSRGATVIDGDITWIAEDIFVLTDSTDDPASNNTKAAAELGDAGSGRTHYPNIVDPQFVSTPDDFFASNLALLVTSPAATGGENWWDSRGITEPLDYFANSIPDLNAIPKGALFVVISGAPVLATPYSDLINLNTDVVSVDLKPNITGAASYTVKFDPAIPSGLSETNTVVSGTVTTPTGTVICTVVGKNLFGKVTDSFQWTTLTIGDPTSGILVPIIES